MSWPLSHDFNEAIQNPRVAFADPDLRDGETVVGATGLPLPRSGNFADVYQVRGADGRDWAVKCFTRPVVGLGDRYARLGEALAKANLPFTVGFTFLAEGIRVGGVWRPIVKMEWVEGLLLNQVIRENAARPAVLTALGQMWVKLCKRLREAGIAHADIQHGNVLLVPGTRAGAYGLKLIDYDGMYVPALANTPSGESGHPSFQHPARATQPYSPDVDRFSHLVVATALRGLVLGGPSLWERYDNGDNLLFTEQDYRKPAESKVMRELWWTNDPTVQALVGRLALACGKPIPQTPWLDELAPEGKPTPLSNDAHREAALTLGIAPPVPVALPPEPSSGVIEESPAPQFASRAVVAPVSTPGQVEVEVEVELVEDSRPKQKRRSNPTEVTKANSRPLLLAGGLLLVGVVVLAAVLAGGKSRHPENVQHKPDEPKGPGEGPKPKEKNSDPIVSKPKDLISNPAPKVSKQLEVRLAWSVDLPAKFEIGRFPSCSADSRTVVAISGPRGALVALDAVTGKSLPCEFNLPPQLAKVSPVNGGRFALLSATGTPTIPVVDPRAARSDPLEAIPLDSGALQFVSPDLRYVAVGAASTDQPQSFKLKSVVDGKIILNFDWVRGNVLFTADSARVLVAEYDGPCRWFKLPSGERDGEWTLQPSKTMKEGRYLFAGSADGSVLLYEGMLAGHDEAYHLINGRTGAIVRSFPGTYQPHDASLSADGALVVLPKWVDNKYRAADIVSTATGTIVAEVTAPADCDVLRPTILPDGSGVVALTGAPAKAIRFDLVVPDSKPKDPPVEVSPPAPEPVVLKAAWKIAADSEGAPAALRVHDQTILWGGPRTSLAALDLQTGAKRPPFGLIELTGGDAFSSLDHGRVAKYAPDDTDVRTWDVKTGKPGEKFPVAAIPPGTGEAKQKLAWLAPNGRYLVVARGAPAPAVAPAVPLRVFTTDKTGKTLVEGSWVGGSVHFTADSARLLVAEHSGRFRWFTLAEQSDPLEWSYPPLADGRTHAVTDITGDGRVIGYNGPAQSATDVGPCLVDGKTGRVLHRFGKGYVERSPVALSSDGRVAAVLKEPVGTDAVIEVVSVPKGTALGWALVATKGAVPTFALSGDARVLLVHDPKAGTLWRFDLP